jgi:hypothetical protein
VIAKSRAAETRGAALTANRFPENREAMDWAQVGDARRLSFCSCCNILPIMTIVTYIVAGKRVYGYNEEAGRRRGGVGSYEAQENRIYSY